MAQAVYLVIHAGVFLYVGVGRGHVGFGLVVVVVAHEIFHPIVGEELSHLVGELGGERLVGRDHEGGALDLLYRPGDGRALAAARDALQGLEAEVGVDAVCQLLDGFGLVACRLEIRHHHERLLAAQQVGACGSEVLGGGLGGCV